MRTQLYLSQTDCRDSYFIVCRPTCIYTTTHRHTMSLYYLSLFWLPFCLRVYLSRWRYRRLGCPRLQRVRRSSWNPSFVGDYRKLIVDWFGIYIWTIVTFSPTKLNYIMLKIARVFRVQHFRWSLSNIEHSFSYGVWKRICTSINDLIYTLQYHQKYLYFAISPKIVMLRNITKNRHKNKNTIFLHCMKYIFV